MIRMHRFVQLAATSVLMFSLSFSISAESLAISPPPPSNTTEYSVQMPGRGMTMEAVENRFGQPLEKAAAVGTPPITRWSYQDFTVYFESEYVIHAVVNNN